jgi:transporter family-2 protein
VETVILIVIVGLIGGLAMGFQGPLASLISQRLGTLESVFIIHLGGAVVASIPLLVTGGGNLAAWRNVPWYALGAGSLGLILISAISYTIPRLGIATTVTLIVVAQLSLGAALDHFGLLGMPVRSVDLTRLLGLAILFLGTWLMVR